MLSHFSNENTDGKINKNEKNITSLNMKWDYAIKIGLFGFG
jgi:hypothetical protein